MHARQRGVGTKDSPCAPPLTLSPLPQASSAYRHALGEVLAAAGVAERIKDTKAAKEAAGLQVRGGSWRAVPRGTG